MMEHLPALIVAIPLFGAFLTPLVGRLGRDVRNAFVVLIMILSSIVGVFLIEKVYADGIQKYTFGANVPSLTHPSTISIPVRIIFEIDGLSVFMVMITLLLTFLAVIYSIAFFREEHGIERFYTLLLLLLVGMLGMELTGDMFNFFVFLEIASISASALIAFSTDRGESLEAGMKYLAISSIGALFFLFALALLYGQYDALNMAMLASSITGSTVDMIALVLVVSALAMKAGIAPMHMWMPDAYGEAPPSVTLSVVAATQASMYGLIRMIFTVFRPSIDMKFLSGLIIALSLVTIVIGATMSLIQRKLTRAIAYAAVAEMGYILLGVGAALSTGIREYGEVALRGAVFHIFNDAVDMGLLFLTAGAVYYATRELDMNNLGGLARRMKFSSIFFMIGLLAASGIPPMNGFASKLLIYESVYALNPILSIIAILFSILMLAIFTRIFYSIFLGPEKEEFRDVKEAPKPMLIAMVCLAIVIIFFGIFPDYVVGSIVDPAVEAIADYSGYISAIIGGV